LLSSNLYLPQCFNVRADVHINYMKINCIHFFCDNSFFL